MTFRIVAWNCAGNFARNAAQLAALNADICIVPEALEPHAKALGERYATHWYGEPGQRGLLIAVNDGWRFDVVATASQRHMILLNVRRDDIALSVIGVWAMRGPRGYAGAVIAGLDELLPLVDGSANVFVAGDYNASIAFDATSPPALRFVEISSRLHAAGLSSLYHDRSGEAFGAETQASYFHQWKREQPFHIDFAFASRPLASRCRAFEIGGFDPWCSSSDHMPLIADFE